MNDESPRSAGWPVVAASGVGVIFSSMFFLNFAQFLKPLAEEFGWSREAVSAAYGSMALAAAASAPLLGHLADRLGTRRVAGSCLALAGSAFASLALLTPRLGHLYAVFVVVGLGATGSSVLVYSRAISSWFDHGRGLALGVVVASGGLGAIVHPPLAQALVRLGGWRHACLVLGAAALAVGVPTVIGFVREREGHVLRRQAGAGGTSVGEALRSRAFWTLFATVCASTIPLNAVIVHLSALLTDRGVDAARAAVAVSAMGGASLAGRLLTGWLIDRLPAPRVSFVFLSLAALGTLVLSRAGSFGTGVAGAALVGFGTGAEADVVPYLLSRYFGLRALSTLYGVNWTAFGLAGVLGPLMMGRAFDTAGSYEAVLARLAASLLAAALLMLALPPVAPGAGRAAPAR